MNDINNNIKLNQILFYECSIYIAYKSTFKEILEFALLSKKSFKIFQNIISNECIRAKILLKLDSLLSYILNTNDHGEDTSKSLKLIKFNEIQNLYTQIPINKTNCQNYRSDQLVTKLPNNYELKLLLPNLKSVYYKNTINGKFYGIEEINFDINNLEKTKENKFRLYEEKELIDEIIYNKVELNWYENDPHDIDEYPTSNNLEFSNFIGENRGNSPTFYPFSFDFLRYQNPKKLYILNAAYKFNHLYSIEALLNFKSIKTIKFISNNTTSSFLNKSLSNSNITSLLVRLKNHEVINNNNDNNNEYDDQNEIIKSSFSNSICNLKRLQLCQPYGNEYKPISTISSLKLFFKYLQGNKSLVAIGLDYFRIQDSNDLLPLLKFKNISTLYCTLYDITIGDISIPSIIPFLNHLNENSNIKHFKILLPDTNSAKLILNFNFHQFFKTNKSLKKLTIQYGYNVQIKNIVYKINRFLINSGNNNIDLCCSLSLTHY